MLLTRAEARRLMFASQYEKGIVAVIDKKSSIDSLIQSRFAQGVHRAKIEQLEAVIKSLLHFANLPEWTAEDRDRIEQLTSEIRENS